MSSASTTRTRGCRRTRNSSATRRIRPSAAFSKAAGAFPTAPARCRKVAISRYPSCISRVACWSAIPPASSMCRRSRVRTWPWSPASSPPRPCSSTCSRKAPGPRSLNTASRSSRAGCGPSCTRSATSARPSSGACGVAWPTVRSTPSCSAARHRGPCVTTTTTASWATRTPIRRSRTRSRTARSVSTACPRCSCRRPTTRKTSRRTCA
ncbi:hypothetical protein SDC9_138097 [bioreactor metagenome]|uniref:Uncharacterized protein n=1 Tax=bioreactor metagenome TaxID=1076179 RepID=A0A645DQI4_9ZZZZ